MTHREPLAGNLPPQPTSARAASTLPPSVGRCVAGTWPPRYPGSPLGQMPLLPQRRWAHIWDKEGVPRNTRGYQRLEDQLAAHLDTFHLDQHSPQLTPTRLPSTHAEGHPRAGPRDPPSPLTSNLLSGLNVWRLPMDPLPAADYVSSSREASLPSPGLAG